MSYALQTALFEFQQLTESKVYNLIPWIFGLALKS